MKIKPLKHLVLLSALTLAAQANITLAEEDVVVETISVEELEAATANEVEAIETEPVISEDVIEDVKDAVESAANELATDSSLTLLDEPVAKADKLPRDIMLVLDNSGSMKKNDPNFFTHQAVEGFINELDALTNLSIIVFDHDVKLAVPFRQVTKTNRRDLLESLDKVNYRGLYTNTPAAIERAIYELKNNGREEAQKIIVFMTDGIVDTGNASQDLERTKWLKEDLVADALEHDIKMFGIAFTEAADFQLIQSLAQKTGGEYYRALQPEDLDRMFDQIHDFINKPPELQPITRSLLEDPFMVESVSPDAVRPEAEPEKEAEPVVPMPPVIIEVPVPVENEDDEFRSMLLIAAVSVMVLALIAILFLLMRKRGGGAEEQYAEQAFLNDIHGYTDKGRYEIGAKATMLGRVGSKDSDHLNHIVIPQSTIGRRHALIEYKDFAFWITDQGSINGTFVNDKRIEGETRLKHGDLVRLHKFEFEFVVPEIADEGKTQMSNTVFAASEDSEDATVARTDSQASAAAAMAAPDFDLSLDMNEPSAEIDLGNMDDQAEVTGPQAVDEYEAVEDYKGDLDFDITGIKEDDDSEAITTLNPEANDDDEEFEGSEETIILDDDYDEDPSEEDDDATIRRGDEDEFYKATDIYPTDKS